MATYTITGRGVVTPPGPESITGMDGECIAVADEEEFTEPPDRLDLSAPAICSLRAKHPDDHWDGYDLVTWRAVG